MNNVERDFQAARRVSTPIVVVTTADQWASLDRLARVIREGDEATAVLTQDCIHGLRGWPKHEPSAQAVAAIGLNEKESINPVAVLANAETRLLRNSVLFMLNAQRHFVDTPTRFIQAVSNVRDAFKENKRMLVLLAPSLTLPAELEGDAYKLDEPRPTATELEHVVVRQCENARQKFADFPMPKNDVLANTVAGLAGLKLFEAEQVTSLSLKKSGVDRGAVWERKQQIIDETPGLSVVDESITFEQIGGLDNVKSFYRRYMAGPNKPAGVVFIDEIEKDTAGMRGDNTGVAQRQHKALLVNMQDKGARGIIHAGQPGSGKSALAKALGALAGVPVIAMNLGDLLGGVVGSSEALMREALKTIDEVTQRNALYVATCNDMAGLSPELRSRFKNGTFYFDLPTEEERAAIWQIYLGKFGRKKNEARPNDEGWVGREIEACCDQAHSLGCSLKEAAQYIVPHAKAMPDAVQRRRREANGAIISASYAGVYQMERSRELSAVGAGSRDLTLGD